MLKLSVDEIIEKIEREETFYCISKDGSFSLTITEYVPYVCAAIHNGGNLRKELRNKCLLNKSERWYEEDPHTDEFISSLPIRLVGNDSRYEYDLNRAPENCIYEEAWGKKIWKEDLSFEDREKSLEKHNGFYKVVEKLIEKIETKFESCIVYDVHSYNYKRITHLKAPMFNIGTANINQKYRSYIDDWLNRLSKLKSDYFENDTKENLVFQGHGHFLKFISSRFENTLVLATEVRKSYCDEDSGDTYPEVIDEIKEGMKKAILENAKVFVDEETNISVKRKSELLASELEPLAKVIDDKLYSLLNDFDLFEYVNPINLEDEKAKFFECKYKKNPDFRYQPLEADISNIKRELYELPIDDMDDITLQKIYRSVIDAYIDQIELLSFRGEDKFRYMSLKYFGEPNAVDLELARYLLNSPDRTIEEKMFNTSESVKELKKEIAHYGFKGSVESEKNIPSMAVFSPARNLVRVKDGVELTETYVNALCHHEIGVHMLTTENAKLQELKIFRIGLPLSTLTQEGIAILSEYKAGLLTVSRLKELALRVVTVKHMLVNNDFKETFNFLRERYGVEKNKAFYLTTRIYRGGGFTKDYLYLRGFRKIKDFVDSGKDFSPLLIGKTSIDFIQEIRELIERGILSRPKYITRSLTQEEISQDEVIEYILLNF